LGILENYCSEEITGCNVTLTTSSETFINDNGIKKEKEEE